MDADRERFDERALVQRDVLGERVREVGGPRDVLGERPVVRRRRHERHVRTEVVLAARAVLAATAGNARFECHTFADAALVDVLADGDDLARTLVAEDQRAVDDVVTDAAVFVVVDVGATDTDRARPDEHLVVVRGWSVALFQSQFEVG